MNFTPGSAEYFREEIEYPFFASYLEGKGSGPASKVTVLPSGETMAALYIKSRKSATKDIRRPEWQHYGQWPPLNKEMKFFLASGNALSAEPGTENEGCPLYYDPKNPVPYTGGILEEFSREAYVADQRFAARRPDVLTFRTPVLKETLKIEGPVKVTLYLDSLNAGNNIDIIVKLIDRRTDGYQIPVRIGARPLRFREPFTTPSPLGSQEAVKLEIELTDIAHHFLPGHRLMLHVQCSMFPLLALPKNVTNAEISLRIGSLTPSSITLPVAL